MVFEFDYDPELRKTIEKLRKKDPERAKILYKKINQIINSDEETIEHYKNLSYEMNYEKRVHVDKSFVLTFHYNKKNKFILFLDFEHHDKVYRK